VLARAALARDADVLDVLVCRVADGRGTERRTVEEARAAGFLTVDREVAAPASIGTAADANAASTNTSRRSRNSRDLVTGKPLIDKLLRSVSAL